MASLAELMFQSAAQNIRDTKSDPSAIARSYAQGVQLAQQQERIQIARENMENQKALAAAKADSFQINDIDKALKIENPKMRSLLLTRVEKKAEAAGRPFAPGFIDSLKASTGAAGVVSQAKTLYDQEWQESMKIGRPTPGLAEARAQFAEVAYGGNLDPIIQAENQFERAKLVQEAQATRQQTQIMAQEAKQEREFEQFPVKELQKKTTADWSKFNASGGMAYVNSKLKKVDEAIGRLKKGPKGEAPKVKTGTWGILATTSIPFTDKMDMIRKTNPEVALMVDELQGIVDVKKALDSQFSDAMADRVFSRIVDPNAPNELNLKRIRDYGQTVLSEARNQMQTFGSQGLRVSGELYQPQNFGEAQPPRQSEGDQQLPDAAMVEKLKQTISSTPALANLSGEQLFQKIKQVRPDLPDETVNQMIRQIKIEQNPKKE